MTDELAEAVEAMCLEWDIRINAGMRRSPGEHCRALLEASLLHLPATKAVARVEALAAEWEATAGVQSITAARIRAALAEPEGVVCLDPSCTREHVGGAGGTPCHLPPDGVVVPGLFDHGVPTDAIAEPEGGE